PRCSTLFPYTTLFRSGFDPCEIGEEMSGVIAPHYAGRAAEHVGAPSVIPLNAALASFEVLRFMEITLGIANIAQLARQRFDYRRSEEHTSELQSLTNL